MKQIEIETLLKKIAIEELSLITLAARNSDSLDFHELSVWQVHRALTRAFYAGREARANSKPKPKSNRELKS